MARGAASSAVKRAARARATTTTRGRRSPSCARRVERAELTRAARQRGRAGPHRYRGRALAPTRTGAQPTWKRVAVIFAGPATNLSSRSRSSRSSSCSASPMATRDGRRRCYARLAAAAAGLQPGDAIVAVDGKRRRRRRATIPRAHPRARGRADRADRRPRRRAVDARAAAPEQIEGVYRLGFVLRAHGASRSPGASWSRVPADRGTSTEAIGSSLGGIVTGEGREEVSSAVGIVAGPRARAREGLPRLPRVLALISLSLALLNLLPLLPLDGGHIAFSIARGHPRPRDPARGLRARLGGRHRARADALLHRALERRRAG